MKGEDIGYGWMFTDGLYFGRMFSKEVGSIYLEQSNGRWNKKYGKMILHHFDTLLRDDEFSNRLVW